MHKNVKNKLSISFKRKPVNSWCLLFITYFKIHSSYILLNIVVNEGSNLNNISCGVKKKPQTTTYKQDWSCLSGLNSKCFITESSNSNQISQFIYLLLHFGHFSYKYMNMRNNFSNYKFTHKSKQMDRSESLRINAVKRGILSCFSSLSSICIGRVKTTFRLGRIKIPDDQTAQQPLNYSDTVTMRIVIELNQDSSLHFRSLSNF